ncbi:MAG TPA: PSD1 and planctomycete cytochrome C domain-containing protein [Tepidisphaeraceae bacterium]|nr:PSD1 and planctomycete cytochrome C domain-containing protein [Tepidisphaeraceae bacterium]
MRLNLLVILMAMASATAPAMIYAEDATSSSQAANLELFEKKIRPLFVENCYECHSANTNAKSGLRVDDRNGLIDGGDHGPAIVPGQPEKSLLLKAVGYTDAKRKMPPKKQLSPEQIADLTQWIKDGAAWPKDPITITLNKPNPRYDALRKQHWAWQPIRQVSPPTVKEENWPRGDIDRFILARLDEKGLKPAPDASKAALIRRVSFDLTGLPPTAAEIDAFVQDGSSDALKKVVDRLLASPAFGERWGRHWLDVARYGESTGPSRNVPYPHAWRYRDYVIDAFNHDKPYDEFIREQIAGDLMPASSQAEHDEHVVATGFLALGPHDVNQRFKGRFVMDNIDEQIDTVGRSVLALTVGCARCHDHKFDPIPSADYYALAGIFYSSDLCNGVRNKMGGGGMDYYDTQMLLHLGPKSAPDPQRAEKIELTKKKLEAARAELKSLAGKEGDVKNADGKKLRMVARQMESALESQLAELTDPAADGHAALGMRDASKIRDTEIRIRGEAERRGPVVPRGFLSLCEFPNEPVVNTKQSGRLELAEWLISPNNPLASRVIVNRVWANLFGQGLVRSVDNFGTKGDVPSHPELLDYLAARFVRDGWSIKKLVRVLVLTHSYQLSADRIEADIQADPSNRLVWRHCPRRLEAEEIRDAMLAIAGTLDTSRPQGSPAQKLKVMEMSDNGGEAARLVTFARESLHRSVYLPLLRGLTPTTLEVFDFAEQGFVVGSRDATTVATQALYLLNDPFVRRQSLGLADRLLGESDMSDTDRIDLAYQLILARGATEKETSRAAKYLSDYESAARKVLVFAPRKTTPAPAPVIAVASANPQTSESGESSSGASAKKAPPVNPDEVVHHAAPVKEEAVQASNPKAVAWASFCQALYGTVEFRFLQ